MVGKLIEKIQEAHNDPPPPKKKKGFQVGCSAPLTYDFACVYYYKRNNWLAPSRSDHI